jgi:predicted exporter
VLIYLALGLRYGPRDALVILLPPAGAALLTLGLLGWIGSPLNLFNLLGLLLVLGMGVDYAIFLREGRRTQPTVLLAIGLSAVTTWIAFAMLSLSATPFVRSIGLTLASGIALVFLLAVWLGPQGGEEDT